MKRIQFLNNLVCEMYRRIVGKGLLSIVLTLCLGSVCNAAVEFEMYQTSSQANQACNADLASYVERYSPWNTCQLSGANCNLVSGENYWLFQVQTSCSAPEYIEKKKYGYSGEKDQYSRYFTRSKAVEACRKFWSDQGKGDKEGEAFNCVDSPSGHIVHDYFGEWDHLTCGHDYHYEPNEAPNLTISSPSSTGSYYYGVPISLRGNVSDDIDSNLSSKIDWFLDSNISLGRGANFYASLWFAHNFSQG